MLYAKPITLLITLTEDRDSLSPLIVALNAYNGINLSTGQQSLTLELDTLNDIATLRNEGLLGMIRFDHDRVLMHLVGVTAIVQDVVLYHNGLRVDDVLLAPTNIKAFGELTELFNSIAFNENIAYFGHHYPVRRPSREQIPGFMDLNATRSKRHQRENHEQYRRGRLTRSNTDKRFPDISQTYNNPDDLTSSSRDDDGRRDQSVSPCREPRSRTKVADRHRDLIDAMVETIQRDEVVFNFARLGGDIILVAANGNTFNEVVQENSSVKAFAILPKQFITEDVMAELTKELEDAATRFWSSPREVEIDADVGLIKVRQVLPTARETEPETTEEVTDQSTDQLKDKPQIEEPTNPLFELKEGLLLHKGKSIKVTKDENNTYVLTTTDPLDIPGEFNHIDELFSVLNVTNREKTQFTIGQLNSHTITLDLGNGRVNPRAKKILNSLISE